MAKKVIKKEKTKELSHYRKEITTAVTYAENLQIASFSDVFDAADFLHGIKGVAGNIENEKKSILKPFTDAVKNLRSKFSPIEADYTKAEAVVKEKILQWHQSEWDAGRPTDNKISGIRGTVTIVERTRVQVYDPGAVPREFCVPDLEKVEHALKAGINVAGATLIPAYSIAAGEN